MKNITQKELIVALRQNSDQEKSKKKFQNQLFKQIKKEHKRERPNFFFDFLANKKRFYVPFTILLLFLTIAPFAINFGSSQENTAYIDKNTSNVYSNPEIFDTTPDTKSSDKSFFEGIFNYTENRSKNNNPVSKEPITQQQLSGREVDDNAFYNDYLKYKAKTNFGNLYNLDLARYKITVLDRNNKPIFGQKVMVGEQLIKTYANGETYFFPSAKDKYTNKFLLINLPQSYKITIGNQKFTRSADEKEWIFKLDQDTNFSKTDLEVAFTLDTTGSMGDQINQLKTTIKAISDQVNQLDNISKVRWGLVLYRDKSDDYITKKYDFTDDINQFQRNLNEAYAGGGGDYPEDANKALEETIENLSWQDNSVKMSFLVTDAPPHMDYGQNYDYANAAVNASAKGIKVYTIASSGLDNSEGEYIYRQLSLVTNAKYLFITNARGDTEYHVDDNNLDVKKLDKLVVDILRGEVGRLKRE